MTPTEGSAIIKLCPAAPMRTCTAHPSCGAGGPLSSIMSQLSLAGRLLPSSLGCFGAGGGELLVGLGSEAEPSQPLLSCSSFSSTDRQTGLLPGASPAAKCGPPVQPQPDGSRVGDAHGCASWGGARGAHPGATGHHYSLSRAMNKPLGGSSGIQASVVLAQEDGVWEGPRDHPQV